MSESRDDLFDDYGRAHVTRLQELCENRKSIAAARQRRGRLTLEEIKRHADKFRMTNMNWLKLVGFGPRIRAGGRRADAESRQNLLAAS